MTMDHNLNTNQRHVIVIGAGIGGLTLGIALRQHNFRVTILEQARHVCEAGAGIQLAPNATRILRRLGVLDELLKYANKPAATKVRRYSDDVEIGPGGHIGGTAGGTGSAGQLKFDAPMLVIHRSDLQHVLLNAALTSGVHLRTNAKVDFLDPSFSASVTLTTGECITGDVLVGADGINSRTRKAMVAEFGLDPDSDCTSTGDSAYRVVIPASRLERSCPEIRAELEQRLSTRWIGPNGHIMAYPIRGDQMYNVVMVHASREQDTAEEGISLWSRKGEMAELRDFYTNWSKTVHRLIACIDPDELMEWPLNSRPSLPAWSVNQTCLLGDACHAMLPYVAQGAAQAIEDAATLAICLSAAKDDVAHAFAVYESLRKKRAEFIQSSATAMRELLHLVDGPEQERRDAMMRAPRLPGWKHPDLWADPSFQRLVWGHDIMAEAETAFGVQNEDSVRL